MNEESCLGIEYYQTCLCINTQIDKKVLSDKKSMNPLKYNDKEVTLKFNDSNWFIKLQ